MITPHTEPHANPDGGYVPDRRIGFVYGSREVLWAGIGYKLFGTTGAIRNTLIRCEKLIRERLGWSLGRVLLADRFPDQHFLEPSQTALQIALTEGWRERGVTPSFIAARCGGEFAGEYARGTLSLEDAIEVACRAARIYRDHRGEGRALGIGLGLADAIKLRRSSPIEFSIVSEMGAKRTLVTGDTTSITNLKGLLESRQIAHLSYELDVAFHSRVLDRWRDQILRPLNGKAVTTSDIPYYSAAAGGRDYGTSYGQRLWRTLRGSAVVTPMVKKLIDDGCSIFVEVGGHPSLEAPIQRCATAAGKEAVVLPTMRRNERVEKVMDESQERLRQLAVLTRPRAAVA